MVNPQGNETKNRNTKNRRQNTQREKWNERVIQISRVTKVCKGGKKLSFRAVVLIGNENGRVGLGVGKADDVVNAITKGITDARRSVVTVFLTRSKTLPHITTGRFGACEVFIKPASQGTGVIAGSSIRTVLELAGVKNILAKQLGSDNLLNNAHATISALTNMKNPAMVAAERNLPVERFYS
jgi:small subunit ribosomal protein S5